MVVDVEADLRRVVGTLGDPFDTKFSAMTLN